MQDFANRMDCTTKIFEENFNNAVAPLATILTVEPPSDEVNKAQLLDKLADYLEVDDTNLPCIQFCVVSIVHL